MSSSTDWKVEFLLTLYADGVAPSLRTNMLTKIPDYDLDGMIQDGYKLNSRSDRLAVADLVFANATKKAADSNVERIAMNDRGLGTADGPNNFNRANYHAEADVEQSECTYGHSTRVALTCDTNIQTDSNERDLRRSNLEAAERDFALDEARNEKRPAAVHSEAASSKRTKTSSEFTRNKGQSQRHVKIERSPSISGLMSTGEVNGLSTGSAIDVNGPSSQRPPITGQPQPFAHTTKPRIDKIMGFKRAFVDFCTLREQTRQMLEERFNDDYLKLEQDQKKYEESLEKLGDHAESRRCINNILFASDGGRNTYLQAKSNMYRTCDQCINMQQLCIRPMKISGNINMVLLPLPELMRLDKTPDELGFWVRWGI
ncbi:hypothetical protein IAQ61_002527 [Plenodomus lingam]|uniref:uncharacterized protein n=1 Tax=Leptosphaeria maculans TaxID=5022 RepID=UPI003326C13D|nr:hypothetical protein IAQ61_002527 [Plenodomus lingam]